MQTTIDASGRLVIPAEIRRRLGLTGGETLDLDVHDDTIEISVAPTPMRLVRREGVLVAETDRPMPTLTAELVRETLERVRR